MSTNNLFVYIGEVGNETGENVSGVLEVFSPALLGDVNLDGVVNFLDIAPFIAVLATAGFQAEADCDENGVVDFLDIAPFIDILSTQ